MTAEFLKPYWALAIASVLSVAILLFVVFRVLQDSRRGRLSRALSHLRQREKALARASSEADKAAARYSRLSARGDAIAPNKVLAAKEALVAAQETERLLKDQVLVVRNTARALILDEYPPARHAAILKKHLGEST